MGKETDEARARGEAVRREAEKRHAEEEAKRPLQTGQNLTSDTDNWDTKPPRG